MDRVRVANPADDRGEYLWELHQAGLLKLELGAVAAKVSHFAPCHQRQQGIGEFWMDRLGLAPEVRPERVGNAFDCCGRGGIMEFKKGFHDTSLTLGARMTDKIRAADAATDRRLSPSPLAVPADVALRRRSPGRDFAESRSGFPSGRCRDV